MNKNAQHLGIVFRPGPTKDFKDLLPLLVKWLTKRNKRIFLQELDQKRISPLLSPEQVKKVEFTNNKFLFSQTDVIISLGGDGTLIGVCRNILRSPPLIFGVNMGRLGFITEFSKKELFDGLQELFNGKLESQCMDMFCVTVVKKDKEIKKWFINDAVVSKHHLSRLFTLSVHCDDDHMANIAGDGLIISSPLGSTAYSMAAGGPIVHPGVSGMILTPICPHGLNHRPLVIPKNFKVSLKLLDRPKNIVLTLDGQEAIDLDAQDIITVEKASRKKVFLIKNPYREYFHTLKEKFDHGKRE